MPNIAALITVAAVMFAVLGAITLIAHIYNLNNIKSKTVGDGQHGTARWANKAEIRKTYRHIPFTPKKWRRQAKQNQIPTMTATAPRKLLGKKTEPTEESLPQGIVVGCKGGKHSTTAMIDTGDVHVLMIGAAGVGKTAFWLYPCIEYACASGMSFLSTDTKGDVMRNYGNIAKDYGYMVSVIDLRNPTRSNGNNILYLVNKYTDLYATHPDQIVYKAKAEKYAKIISKTIILSGMDAASFGQNAYFYDAAEGLLTATILLVAEFCAPEKRHIVSVFKVIQELLAPSKKKGKNQFQQLMELLPNEHKAKWFAGAALNTAEQSMASVMSTALSRLNAFLDTELEQLLCFDTEIDAETFCNQKSAIFVIMPEENPNTFFMISLIIQQLYREILAVADENGGKLKNRCVFFCDEFGTLPKIESAEMMFSASRSRRLQIVPIIQSFSQLQKNYGKEGAEIIVDNATTTKYNGEITEATETTYTYDNAGNRLTSVKKSGNDLLCNVTYVYNGNNQVTDIFGSCDDNDNKDKHVVLSYDANGNLIKTECNGTEKVVDYTYDNENRLKAVKENGTLLMAALYDGNGDRIFRLDYRKNPQYISNRGGTADNVYYNYSSGGISYDHDMIRDEMLIPNDITQNTSINYELTGYINDINSQYTQVLMEYGANQSITNVYEYGAQRNSATINGSKGYYLYDGRGSVASLSGQSGGNMVQYSYDAYGVTTTNYGNQLNNPYRYNAEYTDSSTGNQYLRARYYDAASGRFLTKDTYLGEPNDPLSRNLYTYARNNPTNLIDPSGHLFGTIILAVIATVTVVTAAVTTYNSVKSHNQQSEQIRNQQSSYERNAEVQTGVNTAPTNLRAPSGPNDKGKFSYYNAKDKKVVTFTDAAAYYEYKKLCEELDKLDQNLAISIVHNTLDVLGVIPGYGEVADAANGLIYLAEGDYLNAGLSFVSCIPVAGDAAGKGSKAANKTLGVAGDVAKHGDDIVDAATDIAKYSDDVFDIAKKTGQNPAKVQELLDGGYNLNSAGKWYDTSNGRFISNADAGIPSKPKTTSNKTSSVDTPINQRGITGENQLKQMYGGESQKSFDTPYGKRYVDQYSNKVGHESKVGYTSATDSVKTQIDKDVYLINNGDMDSAHWHFFESPVTGKTGASQPLKDYLDQANILTGGKVTYTIGK